MKPTPTPWIVDGYNVRQPSGRFIAYTGPQHTPRHLYPPACKAEDEANAEFIVRSVNSHEALVEALEESLQVFVNQGWDDDLIAAKKARVAITLATGKEST